MTTFAAQPGDACVAVDSIGRIYVAGTTLHRFTADGQPDLAWAPKADLGPAPACAVDAAGRFLVISRPSACDASGCWAVHRFNDDGNADASFGTGGEVVFGFGPQLWLGPDKSIVAVGLLASGDIVVGSTVRHHQLDAEMISPALARVSTSGRILGTVVGPDGEGVLNGLAVDPLRGILLALRGEGGTPAHGPYVAEYGFDLTPRADFAPARPGDELRDIRRLADGTLIVVDADGKSFSRLGPTGAADPTSPPHQGLGILSDPGSGGATSLLVLADDSVVFSGTVGGRIALVRVRADDAIDATFGDPPSPTEAGGLLLTLGNSGPLGDDLRGAALDARGVVIVAELYDANVWAVARVCR